MEVPSRERISKILSDLEAEMGSTNLSIKRKPSNEAT
jgi:hypothetical protein